MEFELKGIKGERHSGKLCGTGLIASHCNCLGSLFELYRNIESAEPSCSLRIAPWVAELAELRGTRELGIRREELGISNVDLGWTVLTPWRGTGLDVASLVGTEGLGVGKVGCKPT